MQDQGTAPRRQERMKLGEVIAILERRRLFVLERADRPTKPWHNAGLDRREALALELAIACVEQVWREERES